MDWNCVDGLELFFLEKTMDGLELYGSIGFVFFFGKAWMEDLHVLVGERWMGKKLWKAKRTPMPKPG